MKQYIIDEIRLYDYKKIKSYLDERYGHSGIDGIYLVPVEKKMLSDVQAEHVDCQPFFFSIQLDENCLACELLIRTQSRMRCDCMGYANEEQFKWIISLVDSIFIELGVMA